MIFLILAEIVNIVFTLLNKVFERKNCYPIAILISFFVALIGSAAYVYLTGKLIFDWRILLIGAVGGLASYGAVHSFLVLLKLGKFGL